MMWPILILLSGLVFADCGSIKNGTTVSLLTQGNSLANFKLQDQDGLTTCYANSLASVLQSSLPGRPAISYTDLAFKKATYGLSRTWRDGKKKYLGTKPIPNSEDTEAINLTSYGDACIAFNAVKTAGGACAKERSLLENGTISDPDLQEQLLRTLGGYFDFVNQLRDNPDDFAKFERQLKMAMPKISAGIAKLRAECKDETLQEFPLRGAYKGLLRMAVNDYMQEPNDCSKQKAQAIKKFLDRRSYIGESKSWISPSDEAFQKFEKQFLALPGARELITKIKAASGDDEKAYENLSKELEPFLKPLLNDSFPGWNESCWTNGNEGRNLAGVAKSFYSNINYVPRQKCDVNGQNDTMMILKNEWPTGDECWSPQTMEAVSLLIYPLSQIGRTLDENLVKQLLNPLRDHGEQLRAILTPSCLGKENHISLDKASCSTVSTCQNWSHAENNSTYTGPVKGCHTLTQATSMYREKILSEISSQRALSIGICPNFMHTKTPIKSNFCMNGQDGQTKNDIIYHMVTVTGYRCVGDKLEYQLVDSKGPAYCPLYEDPKLNSAYRCIVNSKNEPSGKYWVKEEAMVDNSTTLSTIGVTP